MNYHDLLRLEGILMLPDVDVHTHDLLLYENLKMRIFYLNLPFGVKISGINSRIIKSINCLSSKICHKKKEN